MKKKKTISAALATALALTCMGSGGGTAFAVPLSDADLQTLASQIQQINDTSDSATASETPSAQADAVEGWTIDSNIAQGDEILEMANGWLHLKSTASNGNAAANPSSSNNWPAVAVWGTDYDFSKAGSFHATIKSPQEGSANRFGFYLGYNDPGSGLFIGYDSDGWFWQTYTGGGSGSWYSGARIAAPSANEEHDIQVSWTDAKVATLTVDGQKAFDVDYSAMTNLSNKLAIKAGSWKGLNQVTDVYIKDFPEVVEAAKHAVSGKVVDAEGAAIEGATRFQQFKKITLPMIVPAFTANVTLLLSWGLKLFDYSMTAVKGDASESINVYVYRMIFPGYQAGYGQAVALLWLVVVFIITNFVSKTLRKREVEL